MKELESELHTAITRGDHEHLLCIFEQIYSEYYKLVFFLIGKYIDDNEIVKDLVDETFINFYNNVSSLKTSIKYYLLRSAHNLAINYLQKNRKNVQFADEDISNLVIDSSQYKSHISYTELVSDLLKVLSDKEVNIILLHVVEGYSFKELEQLVGIKSKTLNKVYERAIKKYRSSRKHL